MLCKRLLLERDALFHLMACYFYPIGQQAMQCVRDGLMVIRLSDEERQRLCDQLTVLTFQFLNTFKHHLHSDSAEGAD